jgi:hypothetical protein
LKGALFMRKRKLLLVNLHLFDGAAGGAAGAPASGGDGAAAAQGGTEALPKADKFKSGSSRRSGKTGEFDNVVFGKQGTPAAAAASSSAAEGKNGEGNANKSGVSTTSDSLEAKRNAFKELIEGEYKDQYTEMFQQAFNRRFKETKGMETSLAAQQPIIDMMMQRYNITDGDVAKLQTALESDNAYWEGLAEEAGLTVQQYMSMKKLERENAELNRQRQIQQGEAQAQKQLATWYADAEKVKAVYPTFDFQAECANRNFMGLLKSGIPVQQAYELIHMEEIKTAAAKTAAETAGAQMAAKVQAKAARPKENGMSSQSAVIVKDNVSSLTRKERAEIARRAQRGEVIKF